MKDHREAGLKKCTACGREDGCRCYSKPPSGGSSAIKPCEHDYQFLRTDHFKVNCGYDEGYQHYQRKELFYCRRCLDHKTIVSREETVPQHLQDAKLVR